MRDHVTLCVHVYDFLKKIPEGKVLSNHLTPQNHERIGGFETLKLCKVASIFSCPDYTLPKSMVTSHDAYVCDHEAI